MRCIRCNSCDLVSEVYTGNKVCSTCGTIQEFDNYDAQLGGFKGPQGTNIHVGYTGIGSVLAYKDKKIFEANKLIEDITMRLNISDQYNKIKTHISNITEGEFGLGSWFEVLIGACCYVVMRMETKSVLPMTEIANAISCDLYELGSMIKRVVDHLELKLPEFDVMGLLTRAMKKNARLSGVNRDKRDKITKQGIFLMNCSMKWFLVTGRRPMPMVVAVITIVTQVNGVAIRLEDLAKDAEVAISTCKKRYRELLEKLVEVAREVGLPWAQDVTLKTVIKHGEAIIGYMETMSMTKGKCMGRKDELVHSKICLEDVIRECMSQETVHYDPIDDNGHEKISRYFDVGGENHWEQNQSNDETSSSRKRKCLEMGKEQVVKKKKKGDEDDIGVVDSLPPSYIKGCKAVERRREKIKAAKLRINRIKRPWEVDHEGNHDHQDVDWEDLIIESLILHRVKDEEIEKGYYNTLMDLHVV